MDIENGQVWTEDQPVKAVMTWSCETGKTNKEEVFGRGEGGGYAGGRSEGR